MNKESIKKFISLVTEIVPVVAFFSVYKLFGIIPATITITIATVVCTGLNYAYTRVVSVPSLITSAVVTVFGLITVWSGDSKFIKIKPTIIYLIFAGILWIGIRRGKAYIKHVFGTMILPEEAWMTLSKRFSWFFTFLAISNEFVRIFMSESAWVHFKVFGVTTISVLFILAQVRFFMKHKQI
jgi:intracellular septation protein